MVDPPPNNVACLHSPDLFILISNLGAYGWTQMSAVSFLSRSNRLVLPGETFAAAMPNNQNDHFQRAVV